MEEYNGKELYIDAMDIFIRAGHVATSTPEFINHSPERFVYFDNRADISLSREQRGLLDSFACISRLFTVNKCAFFSIHLQTTQKARSRLAHDIHLMIHPIVGTRGTICLFQNDNEIMLSFVGFGLQCILSDWYKLDDDCDELVEKLDIANISISRPVDYFLDLIYALARYYYLQSEPTVFEVLPIDCNKDFASDEISRDELNQFVEDELHKPYLEYGDDYIEYDEAIIGTQTTTIGEELDLLLLEMDDEDENPFGEEIEQEDDELDEDEDEYYDPDSDDVLDEYEFDDVDPEIFRDPSLMVKWLKKHDTD